jgi:hypothetical protein
MFALGIFALPAQAVQYEAIAEDFRPLSGYVIMSTGGEYLVDLGATQNVNVGDLFAVVKEGDKIVHPVTQKVMGSLDELRAVLQVVRVEQDFSFAKRLRGAQRIDRGEVVKRYTEMTASFWDFTSNGEAVYTRLVKTLPSFKWAQYRKAPAAEAGQKQPPSEGSYDLIFVLNDNGLLVRDAGSRLVKSYPEGTSSSPSVQRTSRDPGGREQSVPVAWERSGAEGVGAQGGGGFEADFPGFSNLGSFPDGTLMADFTTDGNGILIATTDGSAISILTLGSELKELARGDTRMAGKILSVHWWQPGDSRALYVAVTMSTELNQTGTSYPGLKTAGAVFRLTGNQLVPVREQLPYMLGTFDKDADGRKETLLGQEFDRDIFFGQVKELSLENDRFKSRIPDLDLPRNFPVQGSLIADLTGDGQPEVVWVQNRVLNIFSGGEQAYTSIEEMGGTLSQMSYPLEPGYKDSSTATVAFEVSPVAYDLDRDGVSELFAVASEGDFLRAPGIGPGIKKSWLAVFKQRNSMFLKGHIGDEMDMPLQGLFVDDGEIYFVATAPSNWLGKPGKSHLLAFPLAK